MIRVLYAGSPEASSTTLNILIEKSKSFGFEIVGVLTNAPSAQGRHKTPSPTPVSRLATQKNIPVFEPEHLDLDARLAVSAINPDILVCFAYGHLFGPKFMSLFKFGGINLHPSALPEYRGCTPVNAAILNGNNKTAFTIQKVSEKMDEGNILAQKIVELTGRETAFSLLNDAAICGADLFCEVLQKISETGTIEEGTKQIGTASYTKMISKQDALLDWSKSASEVDAQVRAYFSDPCAWTLENGTVLKILEGIPAQNGSPTITSEMQKCAPGTVCAFSKKEGIFVKCGEGFYIIKKLQRQGKNAMDSTSFMNGARNFIGTILNNAVC